MMAFQLSLIEVLKSVPEIREHLVTRRRLLASFLRQPPGPPLSLMSGPDQRLLFRPLRTEAPGKVEFVRALVLHPLVGATETMGLPPDQADTLHLAHNRLGPHLDKGPAGLLCFRRSATVTSTSTKQTILATSASSRSGPTVMPGRHGLSPGKRDQLHRDGRPVTVALDIDSYEEVEHAVGASGYDVRPCQVPALLNR
jgi:hypothetical protein